MFDNISGSNNTACGSKALNDLVTGDHNTALGIHADVANGLTYATAIGPRSYVTQSHTMVLGAVDGINGATTTSKVGIAIKDPQAHLHVRRFDADGVPLLILEDDFDGFGRLKFKSASSSTKEWALNGKPDINDATARFNFRYTQDVLSLHGDGDAVLAGTLTTTSDKRLKKHIQNIVFDTTWLSAISGYNYHWKNTNRSQQLQIGFLAQEVENIFPHLVTKSDENKALNYIGFVPLIIEGVKSMHHEEENIEKRLSTVRKELELLTSKIDLEK